MKLIGTLVIAVLVADRALAIDPPGATRIPGSSRDYNMPLWDFGSARGAGFFEPGEIDKFAGIGQNLGREADQYRYSYLINHGVDSDAAKCLFEFNRVPKDTRILLQMSCGEVNDADGFGTSTRFPGVVIGSKPGYYLTVEDDNIIQVHSHATGKPVEPSEGLGCYKNGKLMNSKLTRFERLFSSRISIRDCNGNVVSGTRAPAGGKGNIASPIAGGPRGGGAGGSLGGGSRGGSLGGGVRGGGVRGGGGGPANPEGIVAGGQTALQGAGLILEALEDPYTEPEETIVKGVGGTVLVLGGTTLAAGSSGVPVAVAATPALGGATIGVAGGGILAAPAVVAAGLNKDYVDARKANFRACDNCQALSTELWQAKRAACFAKFPHNEARLSNCLIVAGDQYRRDLADCADQLDEGASWLFWQ
jgi:hypothetical protein